MNPNVFYVASGVCSADECDRPSSIRGMCRMHYNRLWRAKSLNPHVYVNELFCIVDDCGRPRRNSTGWCNMHHQRYLRNGDPGPALQKAFRGQRTVDGNRYCAGCRSWIAISEFGIDKSMSDGLKSLCRKCSYVYRLSFQYNLSADKFNALLAAQDHRCAICKSESDKTLHIDHDHTCCPGKKSCGDCVRGLLCQMCNQAIGFLQDNPDRAVAAASYLTGSKLKAVG